MLEAAPRSSAYDPNVLSFGVAVLPQWRHFELAEVRTIQVESCLRRFPLAKSSCAKIRNLMSILFNHACRYELFDRNPMCLVRQSDL